MEAIYVPKKLVDEARKMGIDISELVLNAIANVLDLDPSEVASARLELAEKSLEEAREFIKQRNAVQASEKLYKAVEECIKALAEVFNASQLKEVRKRGKWDTWLLGMAATDLSKRLGEERIRLAWKDAYDIHVWGFHEAKYRVEDVEAALPLAEWLLSYTKQVISEKLREHKEKQE